MFATAMDSLSPALNALATSLTRDWYETYVDPRSTSKQSLRVTFSVAILFRPTREHQPSTGFDVQRQLWGAMFAAGSLPWRPKRPPYKPSWPIKYGQSCQRFTSPALTGFSRRYSHFDSVNSFLRRRRSNTRSCHFQLAWVRLGTKRFNPGRKLGDARMTIPLRTY